MPFPDDNDTSQNDSDIAASATGSVVKITDHSDAAVDRWPQQHKTKTTFDAFTRAFTDQIQELEDAYHDLAVLRWISVAADDQLDIIGAIVGQPRDGLSDDDYRRYCYARVKANKSSGLVEEILSIITLILDDDTATVEWFSGFPATYRAVVETITVSDTIASIIAAFLYDATKAGVRSMIQTRADVVAEMFNCPKFVPLDGAQGPGPATVTVVAGSLDANDWPTSGTIRIDEALAVEEDFVYASRTDTVFTGDTGASLASAHDSGAAVTLVDATTGKGLSDDVVTTLGGKLANVKEGS